MTEISLMIPNTTYYLTPGCKIKLSRFSDILWNVNYGWFSFDGNRSICGWYLANNDTIKPLNLSDLDDIIIIER